MTAADNVPHMVGRARHYVRRTGVQQLVEVEEGDILKLGFPDGSFDRVIAEAVAHLLASPGKAKSG